MSELLRLLLANALAAGLLALAAWVLSRRLRRQTLVHGLWVLALVKLVTPPILPLPLLPEWTMPSLTLPEGPAVVVVESRASARPEARTAELSSPRAAAPTAVEVLLATEGVARPEARASTPPPQPEGALSGPSLGLPSPVARTSTAEPRVVDLALLAWTGLLVGALVVAALAGLRIQRFRRLLAHARPAPAELADRVAELAGRVGLRRAPPILLLPARVPPMLWPGRRGPYLLMPEGLLPELNNEERDTLLVHELAHVRRRDHWVRMVELAATILFWWYPVAWWVRRGLRRAEERCCDEWVLRVMPGSAGAYADGLLKSLDLVSGEPDPLPVGASGAGPVRDLETRLKEILMTTRPTPTLAAPARLALAVAALLGLAVFPTQAQSPPDVEPVVAAVPEVAPEPPEPPPPASPAAPADAAPPAPAVEATSTVLAAPAAPPRAPEPRPVVVPAPPVPDVSVAPVPVVAPIPSVQPLAVVAPHPAPRPVVAPAPPIVAPLAPEESPEDRAAQEEFEAQHRKIEAQRAELHRRELEFARQRMARESEAQQKAMQAEVERLRAAGEVERARLVEEQARAAAQRLKLQQRELELEQAQMSDATERKLALQKTAQRLQTLEREGQTEEAAQLRKKLVQLEQEHVRRSLEVEEQKMALRMQAFEVERQAQQTEMELAAAAAAHDRATMEAEIERARVQQEWELAARQQESEAHQAEKALHAREFEIQEHEAAGRQGEAEAARAEAEEMRTEVEALRRGIHEGHLLRATAELELQIESQLEGLRHIEEEGASDASEVQKEIRRLEAALAALRDTES
jgi:beta-lactamase regulating signal transducer with metallopeptidase domain